MSDKSNVWINFFRLLHWIPVFLFNLLPQLSFCQLNKYDVPTQRLLLKMGSCYLNVAKQNQIDIDSGLALASQRTHLNPMLVIAEGEDGFSNVSEAKKLAASSVGLSQLKLMNLIGAWYAFQPAGRTSDLDSAMAWLGKVRKALEQGSNPDLLVRNLSYIGKCQLELGNPNLADTTFTLAIRTAEAAGDKPGEAMAWNYWGEYSPFQPATIVARIDRLRKAEALYGLLNDKKNQIAVLTNISYLTFATGNIAGARDLFQQVLGIEKAIEFPFTHYTIDLLGLICDLTNDHGNGVKYAMDEVNTADRTGDSTALAYFYARRIRVDVGIPNNGYTEALEWGRKALDVFKSWGGDPQLYIVAESVAFVLSEKGRSGEILDMFRDLLKKYPPVNLVDRLNAYWVLGNQYLLSDSVDQAEHYALLAEQLQKKAFAVRGNIGAFTNFYLLGKIYFIKRQFEKSRGYLNTALSYPNTNSGGNEAAMIQKYLAVIDSAAGHFKDAYGHATMYNALVDSARSKDDIKEVAELRAKYEIDKKDNNIRFLSQQTALQEARNKQNIFTRNVMIAGAAVLLIFLALLYNRFRLKQRTNNRLESQKNEIIQKNAILQHLIAEKEWLLKEVHHRVKNNLHTVICLLESQARHLENDALKAIEVSQHRIYAMSLIHQQLYQSEDVKVIGMATYIPELIRYLDSSFGVSDKIHFQLEIDDIDLGVAQAIPVGLIINEGVTNSIKYAFPDGRQGLVRISMTGSEDMIHLTITDNGIGMDPPNGSRASGSLGIKLINGLVEDLNGLIDFETINGTSVRIRFPVDQVQNHAPALYTLSEEL